MNIAVHHEVSAPPDHVQDRTGRSFPTDSRLADRISQYFIVFARLTLAAFALVLFLSALWIPGLSTVAAITLGAYALLCWFSPPGALFVASGIGPLAYMLSTLGGFPVARASEIFVLGFLAGWLVRGPLPRAEHGHESSTTVAGLFVLTVAASTVVSLAVVHASWTGDQTFWTALIQYLAGGYIAQPAGVFRSIPTGLLLIEGIALMTAVRAICTADPGRTLPLVRMVIAGGVGAACLSVLILFEALAQSDQPLSVVSRLLAGNVRLSFHVPDVNAAGSYFVLVCLLAAGASRITEGRRALSWAATGMLLLGLLLSRSRAAFWSLVVVAAASRILLSLRDSPSPRHTRKLGRGAMVLAMALVILGVYSNVMFGDAARAGLWIRLGFTETSLRMMSTSPLFGVGTGNYLGRSGAFMPDWLRALYPRENAHNYFLQVAAELGLVGGILFASLLILPIVVALRTWRVREPSDPLLGGLIGSVVAFLVTCLAGHPFLHASVAYPFWTVLGLLKARGTETIDTRKNLAASGDSRRSSWRRNWTIAIPAVLIVLCVFPRMRAETSRVDLSRATRGLSPWQTESGGRRFRWAGPDATFYIPGRAVRVQFPVQLPPRSRSSATEGEQVSIFLDGRPANTIDLKAGDWVTVQLLVPDRPNVTFHRVDLRVGVPSTGAEPGDARRSRRIQMGEVTVIEAGTRER